jgi:hypothetical protein
MGLLSRTAAEGVGFRRGVIMADCRLLFSDEWRLTSMCYLSSSPASEGRRGWYRR